MTPQPSLHYDAASRAFHWVTALLVVVGFILGPEGFGRLMHDGVDPATRADIVWHESLGVLVFVLTTTRLAWVAWRPAPPASQATGWMHAAGRLAHVVLWALLFALPVTAFLALGSEGHPLTLIGGLRIDKMPGIAESVLAPLADWGEVHGFLGDTMMAVAGLHAAAAIFHHQVLKDGVLATMLPWARRR